MAHGRIIRWSMVTLVYWFVTAGVPCRAADTNDWRELIRQLQQQVAEQQRVIESLTEKVRQLDAPAANESAHGLSIGNRVLISGEGGVAFFHGGSRGELSTSEFRVDEAKLFLDAQIMKNAYFFVELDIFTRESDDVLSAGELYLDIENVSRLWNADGQVNLRLGRLDIPFGEEYLTRDAIDNPLITHSLEDFWGIDEGVELYGKLGKVQYVLAVQNGSHPSLSDYTEDKAVVGRLGIDPADWLHASVSAMRTGDIDVNDEYLTELWIGDAFFRALGPQATQFHAELVQGDIQLKLPRTRLNAAGGYAHVDDNDPTVDGQRDIYFYHVEGVVDATDKLYTAARFSQILAPEGYPIVGNGTWGEYFFAKLTRQIWRLSLGVGYRFSPNLILKTEYMFERGSTVGNGRREDEDLFSTQLTGKF